MKSKGAFEASLFPSAEDTLEHHLPKKSKKYVNIFSHCKVPLQLEVLQKKDTHGLFTLKTIQ